MQSNRDLTTFYSPFPHRLTALVALLLAAGCAELATDSTESANFIEVCEGAIERGLAAVSDAAEPACEGCECPTCDPSDDAYLAAYNQEFGEPPNGNGGAGVTRSSLNPIVPDDVNAQCRRVAQMTYTQTFNCRDYTTWFIICLNDRGYTASGAGMFCKDCDIDIGNNGQGTVGHRIPIVERDTGNGILFCPVEPGWGNLNSIVTSCCRPFRSEAVECANAKWCAGFWPNKVRPAKRYAGCRPDGYVFRDCKSCLDETCTPIEKAQVCAIINHPDLAASCEDPGGIECDIE